MGFEMDTNVAMVTMQQALKEMEDFDRSVGRGFTDRRIIAIIDTAADGITYKKAQKKRRRK